MSIDVNNESGTPVDERALAEVARHALDRLRIHPLAELSVLLVDEPAMTRLHVQWMDEPGPTDVLSFPMDELRPTADDDEPVEGLLGDVVLCPTVAQRQAETAGHTMQDELELLCVHGVLHLLGYDHAEPAEEQEMFGLQRRLLADWRSAGTGRTKGEAP
jgi:probable rRNA maturation factor